MEAIAELLDNAVDEINNGATFIKVDKSINLKDNSPMLVFQDYMKTLSYRCLLLSSNNLVLEIMHSTFWRNTAK
ncbi:hypothetical protein C2845_PM02G16360 [Panicum miliaceum]|uniref:Uncharacterized protein n=1 Tax=Panicum miliaceum TaxID=4540 RepID=A0A3L6SDT1_PANMI|nr:hypothetical protein C2845_PM02G16360 [Panicum miliaceum]